MLMVHGRRISSTRTHRPSNCPANQLKTRKNIGKSTSCSSERAQNTNPEGVARVPPSPPGAPKVRTLCSKWQLECPKSEPFAQNGSWNAKSTNPLRKMAAQAPKVRTLCSKWQLEPKSTNPLPEMAAGAPKVRTLCPKYKLERPRYNLRLKQVALTFGLLPIMH